MNTRTSRIAAAAVIAVAFLVPLSYGTSGLLKRLAGGSYETDEFTGPFQLDRDIQLELQVGTKAQPQIVSAGTVRFFVEDEQIRGTLRYSVASWPKYEWRTRIELQEAGGNRLLSTEHVTANAGVEIPAGPQASSQSIHFSLGSAARASEAKNFRIRFDRASEKDAVTPDAWVEGGGWTVVHGCVASPDGKPVAGAIIQIRGTRPPGQRQGGIWMRNVVTDRQGFYTTDAGRGSYRVGAILYEPLPSGQGYRYQRRPLGKVLNGSQAVNFEFGPFPVGGATLTGTATDPNGSVVREFTVDVRLNVDLNDESPTDLYEYGFREMSIASDGRFKVDHLPSGTYEVTITPTANRAVDPAAYAARRRYVCELRNGQETRLDPTQAQERAWHGRVLFEDGTPAVMKTPELRTQIVTWGRGYTAGRTIAMVDSNGHFAALMPEEGMRQLRSGEAWLTVVVAEAHMFHEIEQGERFSVELLSLERDKAGIITIKRPQTYYGRILYENGRPAVLPVVPWPGAQIQITLRDARTMSPGWMAQPIHFKLDSEGYFAACLSDKLLREIKEGRLEMAISHPSYAREMVSCFTGQYPNELLAKERGSGQAYILSFAGMHEVLSDLKQNLDSAYMMEDLAAAMRRYADDHGGNDPAVLSQLAPYLTDPARLIGPIEYVPPGPAATPEPEKAILAYDKTLLDATGNTHVLFRNGHLEFCRPRQLRALGITDVDAGVSP